MPFNYFSNKTTKTFDPARVNDAAEVWASLVFHLPNFGLNPSYIELSNEPQGHWTTYIDSDTWAKLACKTR